MDPPVVTLLLLSKLLLALEKRTSSDTGVMVLLKYKVSPPPLISTSPSGLSVKDNSLLVTRFILLDYMAYAVDSRRNSNPDELILPFPPELTVDLLNSLNYKALSKISNLIFFMLNLQIWIITIKLCLILILVYIPFLESYLEINLWLLINISYIGLTDTQR